MNPEPQITVKLTLEEARVAGLGCRHFAKYGVTLLNDHRIEDINLAYDADMKIAAALDHAKHHIMLWNIDLYQFLIKNFQRLMGLHQPVVDSKGYIYRFPCETCYQKVLLWTDFSGYDHYRRHTHRNNKRLCEASLKQVPIIGTPAHDQVLSLHIHDLAVHVPKP